MITGINESRTLTKHISCKFDGRKCNLNQSGITISVSVIVKIQKNSVKKVIFGILQYVAAKMVNMQDVLVIQ